MILPVSHEMFAEFLVKAKCQTYAAQGDDATLTPLVPGSRQLEYRDGPLLYRDIYFGGAYFVGQETVYYNSSALWAMGYAGGVTSAVSRPSDMRRVYDFTACLPSKPSQCCGSAAFVPYAWKTE